MPETFVSERFGEITYTQDDVLSFPRGLPAFENNRSWVLVGDEDNAALVKIHMNNGQPHLFLKYYFHHLNWILRND